MPSGPSQKPKQIFFFVDNIKYETDQATLTGAQIKARVPNLDSSFSLFLEGHGNEEDQQIGDEDSVSLEKEQGPRRFFTAPPATFGRI
jgi:hypothetical protein